MKKLKLLLLKKKIRLLAYLMPFFFSSKSLGMSKPDSLLAKRECLFENLVTPSKVFQRPFIELFSMGQFNTDLKAAGHSCKVEKLEGRDVMVSTVRYTIQDKITFKISKTISEKTPLVYIIINGNIATFKVNKESSIKLMGYKQHGAHVYLYFSAYSPKCEARYFSVVFKKKIAYLTLFENL